MNLTLVKPSEQLYHYLIPHYVPCSEALNLIDDWYSVR